MNEITQLDFIDSDFSDERKEPASGDGPVVLSRKEGEYQAKFGIELDGVRRPGQSNIWEDTRPDGRSEAALISALLQGMGNGQEIAFRYSWQSETLGPTFTWKVVGSTKGEDAAHVLDQTRDLFHSIQFALSDASDGAYSWAPSHKLPSQSAGHSHHYLVRPDWMSITAIDSLAVGFANTHATTGKVLLAYPVVFTGGQMDSVLRVGQSGFGDITVAVNASAVKLTASETDLIASADQTSHLATHRAV